MINSLYIPSDISFAFIQDKNGNILVQFIANEYVNEDLEELKDKLTKIGLECEIEINEED